jgi:NAD(P)-dependent dehydrogenase (short-subunit alcohol dehydrogenase family)
MKQMLEATVSRALEKFLVRGKCAVVTGGGDGIGRAVALLLAEAGAAVAVLDHDAAKAEAVRAEIAGADGKVMAVTADVSDEAAVEAAFSRVVEAFGPVDILVNNAGVAVREPADILPRDSWDRVLAVNLTGMFLCARIAARSMRGRSGAIVNTASIMGFSGGLYPNVAYQTTKGGVVNMTRALALEWVGDGIRVNAVAPTFVRTNFIAGLMADPVKMAHVIEATPMHRLAEPEEIAAAILFLSSPAASMITGVTLPVDGGFLAR